MRRKKEKIKSEKNILPTAIIGGLLVAIIIYAVMINAEKHALEDYEKGEVFVAVSEVPKGILITKENFGVYFEIKEVDAKLIPKKAVKSLEQLEGLIPCGAIDAGTLITLGMFENINDVTAEMPEPVIAGFKSEDLYQVVGGVLRAGDRIHIYTVEETGEAVLCWENIYIEEVFDASGTSISNGDTVTAAQRINVYLDKADIEAFYTNLANGALRVVKVL